MPTHPCEAVNKSNNEGCKRTVFAKAGQPGPYYCVVHAYLKHVKIVGYKPKTKKKLQAAPAPETHSLIVKPVVQRNPMIHSIHPIPKYPNDLPSVGSRLGTNLTIGKKLGEGTYGVVYLAKMDNPAQTVVVKVSKKQIGSVSSTKEDDEGFYDEMRMLKKYSHQPTRGCDPRITCAVDAGYYNLGGTRGLRGYLVLEKMDGDIIDMFSFLLKSKKYTVDLWHFWLRMMKKISADLFSLHKAFFFHLDFKGPNILYKLSGAGMFDFKMSDLGLACLFTEKNGCYAGGTYIAPEWRNPDGKPIWPFVKNRDSLALGELYAVGKTFATIWFVAGNANHPILQTAECRRLEAVIATFLEKDPNKRDYQGFVDLPVLCDLVIAKLPPQMHTDTELSGLSKK
jgi:serine/threonine protein kinase